MEAIERLEDEERAATLAGTLRPAATLPGTDGPDEIRGTPRADEIDALGGDDKVNGRGGDDVIEGGDGADILRGAPGDDTIRGGPGDDDLNGGGGNDTLDGGPGADLLRGKGGSDELLGGEDDDTLRGGARDDTLSGDAGDDRLIGGGGSDDLRGNDGDDRLDGGGGGDELRGGAGADTLEGGAGDDLLEGGADDDTLIGGRGTDQLGGGPGADLLDGKGGLDILVGGPGPDVFAFTVRDGTGDRVLDFVQGEDQLDLSAVLPDFGPDDDLDQFVQLEIIPQGTVVRIDPSGSGSGFELLAGLEGVSIDAFSPRELGLPTGLPSAPTVVSTNAADELANGTSFLPSFSQDATFVTFSSAGDNLVEGDDNGAFDVFRKNLLTGEVELVSRGAQPGNDDSFFSALSATGEVVAFESAARNLVTGETGQSNVFVTTVGSDAVELASIVGNRFAGGPVLSDDGRLVAFSATATGDAGSDDPAPLDTIMERVYVRDLRDGSLLEASSDAAGDFADGPSGDPDISADGRFVAFESTARNLIGADTNNGADIYVKSLIDGSVQLASADASGAQGRGGSTDATISGDGRFVAFRSTARLLPEDDDRASDIYLKDLQSGALKLVTEGADGPSFSPSISDDGRFIAFRSAAENLVADDGNGRPDIFVADTVSGQFVRFALASDTSGANEDLVEPVLSGDGRFVAYVDQVAVAGNGSLTDGDVVVAPVDGFGAGALGVADVLSDGPAPTSGPSGVMAAAAPAAAADLDQLVVPPTAA